MGSRTQAPQRRPTSTAWDQIKALLAEQLTPQEFENWLQRTAQVSLDNGSLLVQVPDPVTKDFLEQEYGGQIDVLIHNLNLPITQVIYVPQSTGAGPPPLGASYSGRSLRTGGRRCIRGSPISIRNFDLRISSWKLQSVRARGVASCRQESIAYLQSAVHLRRRRHG